ncbi:Bcr/CflA family efflux MFS transporter [Aquitalea sp. S1-19]|nr:Bcr/CflA family efflux MFS transporter [Aquitalea sp. S1-19]
MPRYAPPLALILAALATLGPFAIDTFLPAMPAIAGALSVSELQTPLILSAYMASFGLMMLWHGAIADAVGRRPVLLVGTFCYALAALGCTFADSFAELIAFRVLQGVSGGVGLIVGRAIIRDCYHGIAAQKLMSHVTMLFALSPALAPVIGGWLFTTFGWRAVFAFMAIVGALLFLLCLTSLPETHPVDKRTPLAARSLLANYRAVAGNPRFRLYSVAVSLNFVGFFVYVPSAPAMLIGQLGLGPNDFLWLFGPAVAGMIIGAWLSGRAAGRFTARQSVNTGYAMMLAAALANTLHALLFAPSLPASVLPIGLYTMGMSLAAPSITLAILDLFPAQRGTASSMQGFVQTLTGAVVAGTLAPLIWHSVTLLAIASLTFSALGLVFVCLARRHAPPTPAS